MTNSHHSPPSPGTHFRVEGSPLDGKRVPMDWALLTFAARAARLQKLGWARTWKEGCRLLGLHAAAAAKAGKRRLEREEARRRARWWDR